MPAAAEVYAIAAPRQKQIRTPAAEAPSRNQIKRTDRPEGERRVPRRRPCLDLGRCQQRRKYTLSRHPNKNKYGLQQRRLRQEIKLKELIDWRGNAGSRDETLLRPKYDSSSGGSSVLAGSAKRPASLTFSHTIPNSKNSRQMPAAAEVYAIAAPDKNKYGLQQWSLVKKSN